MVECCLAARLYSDEDNGLAVFFSNGNCSMSIARRMNEMKLNGAVHEE